MSLSATTWPSPITSTSPGRSGRGPTKLMSPTKMFQSCGSSSIAVARRNLPTRVIRGSCAEACTGPVRASASGIIERNLSARKIRPFKPTRSCVKNTGPPSSIFTAAAKRTHSGSDTTSPAADSATSNARFTAHRRIHACHSRQADEEVVVRLHGAPAIESPGGFARAPAHGVGLGAVLVKREDPRGERVGVARRREDAAPVLARDRCRLATGIDRRNERAPRGEDAVHLARHDIPLDPRLQRHDEHIRRRKRVVQAILGLVRKEPDVVEATARGGGFERL